MAVWRDAVLTKQGLALQAKLMAGVPLVLTKAVTGSGKVAVPELENQTGVTGREHEAEMEPATVLGETVKLPVFLTNAAVTETDTVYQVGIYANDPDAGEILYYIIQNETGVTVPSPSEEKNYTISWEIEIGYGNATEVEIMVDDSNWITYSTALSLFLEKTQFESDWAKLRQLLEDSQTMTLTGEDDPTGVIQGKVGQFYLNTTTGSLFVCQSVEADAYIWKNVGKKPIFPEILVTAPAGTEISCSNGEETFTATSTGMAAFTVEQYSDWVLEASLSGKTVRKEVSVCAIKQYQVIVSFFSADLTVTAAPGAVVTALGDTEAFTGVCGEDGVCTIAVETPGKYTVTAIKDGASSTAVAVDIVSEAQYTAEVKFITLEVTASAATALQVTNGNRVLTGTGTTLFYLPDTGIWTVTAMLSGEMDSKSVPVQFYQKYTTANFFAQIFGVVWNYGEPSSALTRLTKENDPHGFVTVNITKEPQAATDTAIGSSPFDNYMPWQGMTEYNIVDNEVKYASGDLGFSRRAHDTVVKIPEYYYCILDDAEHEQRYFYVADKPAEGFMKHPGSNRYIGKYNCDMSYCSKRDTDVAVNRNWGTVHQTIMAKGDNWFAFDIAAWNAVQLLYLVEFADFNSRTKVGRGNAGGSRGSLQKNGLSDSMRYHTGTITPESNVFAMQYRWIENLWGNASEWIYGIYYTGTDLHINLDLEHYIDRVYQNHYRAGWVMPNADGYMKALGYDKKMPWLLFHSAVGGSSSTYITDNATKSPGVICAGGSYDSSSSIGLFAIDTGKNVGSRLMYCPEGNSYA